MCNVSLHVQRVATEARQHSIIFAISRTGPVVVICADIVQVFSVRLHTEKAQCCTRVAQYYPSESECVLHVHEHISHFFVEHSKRICPT